MANTQSQDIVILDIEDWKRKDNRESTFSYIKNFLIKEWSITLRQKVIFFRILATMVNASLTILKSLSALKKQEKDKNMIKFYDYMITRIQSGTTMHEALESYYGCFNDAEVSIIEAGERTGKLNTALIQIADQTEKVDSITRKIKGAMTYPLIMVVGMVACTAVLMIKVIPTLTGFFWDPKNLPLPTQYVIMISNFFIYYWYLIAIGIGWCVAGLKIWKKTKTWKYRWDTFLIHMPLFGPIMTKVILSKFSRVFSNLLSSWVAVVEAIRIVSSAVGNEVYRQRLLLLRQDIKNGQKIAESLEDDPLFPDLLISMIRVGEETAQIGDTIIKIADFYDEEVDIAIGSIQKLMEPVIIVVMWVVIGALAVAIFLPIMNLAGTISG